MEQYKELIKNLREYADELEKASTLEPDYIYDVKFTITGYDINATPVQSKVYREYDMTFTPKFLQDKLGSTEPTGELMNKIQAIFVDSYEL